MQHEFLKFIATPTETKQLGVAVVRTTFNDPQRSKIITRHKVMNSEKGGYWVNGAALKTGVANGKDTYADSFQFDSSYENDELRALIIESVTPILQGGSRSVFDAPPQSAPQPQRQYQQPQPEPDLWNAPLVPPTDDHVPF